jgi:hypothetical protein
MTLGTGSASSSFCGSSVDALALAGTDDENRIA